jgi:hypothetical protein
MKTYSKHLTCHKVLAVIISHHTIDTHKIFHSKLGFLFSDASNFFLKIEPNQPVLWLSLITLSCIIQQSTPYDGLSCTPLVYCSLTPLTNI